MSFRSPVGLARVARTFQKRRAVSALAVLGLLSACGSQAGDSPGPSITPTAGTGATSPPVPSTAGSVAPPPTTPVAPSTSLPCAISQILVTNCQSCHAATPINGAPMPLVTLADVTAPARTDASMKVYQMMIERVQDRSRPMPPDPTKHLSNGDIATLQSWVTGGAQGGVACAPGVGSAGTGNSGGAPAAGSGGTAGSGSIAGASGAAGGGSDPLDADIENCYELRAHGQPTPGDTTKYAVPAGETYTSFIFKSPWTTPVQGLRFRHLPDNVAVLHHWLLYSESAQVNDGEIDPCALAGAGGLLCGQATTRSLITGWAPGRGDFRLPTGVGLELPAPGKMMAIEFHYYNTMDGAMPVDQSGVEICVTSKFRTNTAAVTWLGSENINVAAHQTGTATGTCTPQRKGIGASDPIHVLYSWPHMHKLGTHMKSVVMRSAGTQEVMYDGDFSFSFQVLHDTPLLLQAGDTITTTCTYQNTTDGAVTFGQSTDKEMCFNFTYAWPAHALDNPNGTLGGAANTCLH